MLVAHFVFLEMLVGCSYPRKPSLSSDRQGPETKSRLFIQDLGGIELSGEHNFVY